MEFYHLKTFFSVLIQRCKKISYLEIKRVGGWTRVRNEKNRCSTRQF